MAYGSLINSISGTDPNYVPKVGDGATMLFWTDRKAGTVISVSKSGKRIEVQQDKAIRTDSYGMSDSQSYRYEADPNGTVRAFTKRKNGQFIREGDSMRGGQRVAIGYRNEYFDYSF